MMLKAQRVHQQCILQKKQQWEQTSDLTPNHSEMISKLADAHINAETVKQRHTDAHINAETVKQMHADAHINAATVKHSLKSSKETAKQAS